jgi:hypothetical protein
LRKVWAYRALTRAEGSCGRSRLLCTQAFGARRRGVHHIDVAQLLGGASQRLRRFNRRLEQVTLVAAGPRLHTSNRQDDVARRSECGGDLGIFGSRVNEEQVMMITRAPAAFRFATARAWDRRPVCSRRTASSSMRAMTMSSGLPSSENRTSENQAAGCERVARSRTTRAWPGRLRGGSASRR